MTLLRSSCGIAANRCLTSVSNLAVPSSFGAGGDHVAFLIRSIAFSTRARA